MKKKILTIFILLFSIFLFCGCGSINYAVVINSDGTVKMQVTLKVDATIFDSTSTNYAGNTFSNFKSNVQSVANQVVLNMYNAFEDSVQEIAVDGVVETYTGDMTVQEVIAYTESRINPVGRWPKVEWLQQNNWIYCTISLTFSNIYAYRYFNGTFPANEDEVSEGVIETREDNLFYVEDKTYQDCVFNDIENNSIAKYFLEYFGDYFTVDDMTYSFAYSTTSSKLYSDADEKYQDTNGNYVHIWHFNNEKLKQDGASKICTYTVKIRTYVWYVLAIVVSVFVGIVLFVGVKIYEHKHKEKNATISFGDYDIDNFDISTNDTKVQTTNVEDNYIVQNDYNIEDDYK